MSVSLIISYKPQKKSLFPVLELQVFVWQQDKFGQKAHTKNPQGEI